MEKVGILALVGLALFNLAFSHPVDNLIETESLTQSRTHSNVLRSMLFAVFSFLLTDKANEVDAEYGDHFEGDIILNEQQIEALNNERRNGLVDINYRWPNNTIPYQLSPNHTTAQNAYILQALNMIESVSCVRFQPRINETEFIQLGVRFLTFFHQLCIYLNINISER